MFVYSFQHVLATNLQNLLAHLSTRAPEHNSSCGPSPHRRSISDGISDRAARASGQIGCPVRLLTFGRGREIWAVKMKVRRMLRDAASGSLRQRGCAKTKAVEILEGERAETKTKRSFHRRK